MAKGLDPDSILKRYRETGKKTVLFDFAETGKSVASLLSVITSFDIPIADRSVLQEALVLYVYYPVRSIGAKNFSVNGFGFKNLSDSHYFFSIFSEQDKNILVELANTDKNRLTAKNPVYNYKELESDFDPNTNIEMVTAKIKKSIETLVL